MTKLQILALLLASVSLIFVSCTNYEITQEPDVYKVTPDLRARIDAGMRMSTKTEKKVFNEKFDRFLEKCDEMAYISNPNVYMETEEYIDFKNFVLSSAPRVNYLVMDKFLKGKPGFFSYIIYDLLIVSDPATADQIAEEMKAVATLQESFYLYPQLCLDIWITALENE
ncbi:MAG: hypothetical protein LUD46_22120 [Parabacteroides sp.]|nr:hypothetical protein [Parabacteroides sp.]